MVNNNAIKRLPRKAIIYLNVIFNGCLKLGYFPKTWKIAKVIAIPKPGKDHSIPENYRPISFLCCMGKIFEKLLEKRIAAHSYSNNTIPDSQFGFRPSFSTTHQVHRMSKNITQ